MSDNAERQAPPAAPKCGYCDQPATTSNGNCREHYGRPPAGEWAEPDALKRPRVVCLCGSTRFYREFQEANYRETMAGHIVLSVGFYPHSEKQAHGEEHGCTPEQKLALDELHKKKIDLADEVLVLDVNGYIGQSTRGEIEHAERTGKPIRYLSNE